MNPDFSRGRIVQSAIRSFCVLWLATIWSAGALAQSASLTNGTPSESFAGEQFCFDASWTNTGATGFGPYIRLILPADITFDSASFLGTAVSTTAIGTFPANPGNQLTDPRSDVEITGPAGGTLTLIVLPLGSVVTGGANIVTNLCATISTDAAIGVPLDVSVQPVYEFGNTATGINGPIDGAVNLQPVTPTLIVASKSQNAPESERPPGPSFEYEYQFTVDVANGQTVENILLADTLPPDVQYVGPVTISGGVGESVDIQPSAGTPGGSVEVSLDSITGTTSGSDVSVSFPVHIVDTLDESNCSAEPQQNALTVDAEFPAGSALPQITDDTTVTAKHLAIQKGVTPNVVRPGNTVTFTLDFQLSEFATATDLVLTDVLEDGFTFGSDSELTIGGSTIAIVPTVVVDSNGVTTLTYDVGAVEGNIVGPAEGSISYTATVDETYTETGLPVHAQDAIGSSVTAAYDLTAGAAGCTDSSGAGVTIEGTSISKTIVSPQAEYMPGDVITFRLTKTIPSGDTRNVVFEDFFPLPVLDVTSIDLTFGNDVTFAPADSVGTVPNISIDGPTNSLTLDFGDVSASDTQTIAVDVDIAVVDQPFADGLFSTNLFQATNSNTPGVVAVAGAPVQFNVRAPDLQITKGISASSNSVADATITPSPSTLPVDGDIQGSDAGDTVTFVITVENQGGASAFDVLITDTISGGLTGCLVTSVVDGDGNPLANNSGDLFAAGLLLTNPLAANDGTIGAPYADDTALLTVTCDVDSAVNPQDVIENTSEVTFASQSSASSFPPRSDTASVTISTPSITKSVESVSPGAATPNVTAGDTVTYRITVTSPEGQVDALSISDALPAGFEFQSATLDTTGFNGSVSLASAAASGTVATGQTVAISFGGTTTVSGDNTPSNNSFAVTVVALVRNVAANEGLPAVQTKTNTASLDYTGRSGIINDTAAVDFAEPNLQLTKTMSPDSGLDAGDTVTVTLALSNTGTAPAYDLVITDTLNDDGTLFDLASIAEGTTPAGYSFSYADPTVTISADAATALAPGATVTFTFAGTVQDGIISGSTFGNTANATADTQDGTVTGERQTSASDTDSVSTRSPATGKAVVATSEPWTPEAGTPEVAIGELITYRFTVEIPEGVTTAPTGAALIVDALPAGLFYQTGSASIRANSDTPVIGGNFSLSAWGLGDTATANRTLRRNADVCAGDADLNNAFNPADEWSGFAVDTFDGLGTHNLTCGTPADILISEYVEGTGDNQAIELFNDTGGGIDLGTGNYVLQIYADGALTPTSTISLTGTIGAGDSYVIANSAAAAGITSVADQSEAALNFDGNDVLVLRSGGGSGTVLDSLGQIEDLMVIPGGATSIVPTVNGQDLEFDIGDISNGDRDPDIEQLIIEYDVLVENRAVNNRTDSKTNSAQLNYENESGGTQSLVADATVTVAESNLSITKSATPSSVTGGSTVTFTVVLSNEAGTNVTRAWEPEILDDLPTRFQNPSLTSAVLSRGAVDLSPSAIFSGNQLTVDMSALTASEQYLDAGESITVVYTADVDPTIAFEESVSNTASALATSLPDANGTDVTAPGSPGSDDGERTGSSALNGSGEAVNDLSVDDTSTVTAGRPTVTKSVADDTLQIGETTEATLVIDVPVGTTDAFVLTDNLPGGLRYTGTAIDITLPSSDFSASLSPSTVPGASTDPLVFDFGTVTNSASAAQQITVVYEVVLENVLANQNGATLTNTATLSFTGATMPLPADSATITVLEPNLDIEKTITAGAAGSDAGDTVSYQIILNNTSANATAYRVDFSDQLPPDLLGANAGAGPFFESLSLDNDSDAIIRNSDAAALVVGDFSQITTDNTGDTLTLPLFDVPPGAMLTITYDATVTTTAPAGSTQTNPVDASYHSLANGGSAGRDGSSVGSDDDNNDDLDNYNESDSAALTLDAALAIQKTLNDAQPDSNFTIGDLVTFDLQIDIAEGTTGDVLVVDTLPAGLDFVTLAGIVAASNISYDGPGTAAESPAGTVTIELGTVINTADGDNTNDSILLELEARVLDVIGNADGSVLTNSASASSAVGSAGPDTVDITIVEPTLVVTKTPGDPTPTLGDPVTWAVEVRHDSGSTSDAFDVELADVIPSGLTYVPGSTSGQASADETSPNSPVFDLGTITLSEVSKSFSFQTTVDSDAVVDQAITNTIDFVYSSQSGTPAVERDYVGTGSGEVTPATIAFIEANKTVLISNDLGTAGQVDPGDRLRYTIGLENTASRSATSVVFTDVIPINTTYVASSLSTSKGITDESSAPLLSVDIGGLAASESVTITFEVTVDGGTPAGTVISNQGFVDSDQTVPEPTDVDGVDANGDQPTDIPVGGTSPVTDALYALKGVDLFDDSDASGTVTPNDTLEYFVILINEGAEELTNPSVSDTIPAGLSYVPASAETFPAGGSVNVIENTVSATFSSLATGETAIIVFRVVVDDPLINLNGGPNDEIFQNQAVADSDQTGPVLSDSNADPSDGNQPTLIGAVDGIPGSPQIDVEKRWTQASDADGDGLIDPDDQILYSIIVSNTGSASASDLRLSDITPTNTAYLAGSAATSQGAISGEDPLSVNIGTLEPGGFALISFRVVVDGGTPDGTIIANQANVTGDGGINENSDDNGRDNDGINPTLTPVDTGGGSAVGTPGGLSKMLVASSETESSGMNVLIGEVLTYRLGVNLPVGTLREVTLFDTLPSGLRYVPGTARLAREFDTGLITSRNPGGVNETASGTFVSLTDGDELIVLGDGLEVFLGDMINSDNDVNDERLLLEIDVVVENIASNQAGDTLTNQGSVSYFNQLGQLQNLTPVAVTTTVIEPDLTISKTASPTAITTAGGEVEYTVVLSNSNGASTATAYDLQVTDVLPVVADSLSVVSITPVGGVAGITDNSTGTTLDLTVNSLPPGASVTIVYRADYPAPQTAGSVMNSVDLTWTGLPGNQGTGDATPGNSGDEDGERTGSGIGPNDYQDTDMAAVAIGRLSLDKSVVDPQTRYAVGDTVEYRVEVMVPPGVNLAGTTLTDVLDSGLEYVAGSYSLNLDAGLASTNTPTDFTRTADSPSPGQETLGVDLGTVSNTSGDMRAITLSYSALVENLLSNQDNQSLGNEITLSIIDTGAGASESLTSSTSSTVGEPRLELTKNLTSPTTGLDAGDTVSFEVQASNTGTTTAFEVVLSDILPAGLENLTALMITGTTGGAQTPALTNNGSDWQSSAFDLPVGAEVTVTFDADLSLGVIPGEVIQNMVSASFTSRNGEDPNERDGSDAGSDQDDGNLDNYNADAMSPSFTVADPVQIDKRFAPDPANNAYTIGEQVTYRLTASLIEGTLADLVVTDYLPSTVRFESAAVGFGNMGMTAQTVPTGMVTGNTVTFDFGDITNPANGNAADDFITVDLVVTVLDVPANVDGTALGNNASLSFTGAGGTVTRDYDADAGTPGIQPLDLMVIEPDLQLLKSVNPETPAPGALLRYTLVLDHTVASTADAFDLQVIDTLPEGLTYVPGSASPVPSSVVGRTLTFDIAALTLATDQVSISYEATVDAGQSVGAGLTNVATLSYSTLSGIASDERSYSAGDDATVTVSDQAPDLVLTKDDGGASASPGGGLVYTLSYANEGPLLATGVVITETVPANTRFDAAASAAGWDCTPDDLPSAVCTLSLGSLGSGSSGSALFGLVVDEPVPAGANNIANTALISDDGTQGFDLDPANNSDDDTTPLIAAPDLTLVKDDGDAVTVPDGVLVYTLSFANVGNQGASGVILTDLVPANTRFEADASSLGWVCSPDDSAGSSCSLMLDTIPAGAAENATFAVRIDDPLPVAFSQVDNTASIADDDSNGADPTPENNVDSDTTPVDNSPILLVEKALTSAPTPIEVGSVLVFTITATNSGNATLTNVTIVDDLITRTNGTAPCLSVAPGDTCTLIGEYVVTQGDINAGSILNTATGDSDQTGPGVDQVTVPLVRMPGIELVKTADTEGPVQAGDSIGYLITVTNTGNVTLSRVEVQDSLISLECVPITPVDLEPAEQVVCTGNYEVQTSDIGQPLVNVASVTGSGPDGEVVAATDEAITSILSPVAVNLFERMWLIVLLALMLILTAGLRFGSRLGALDRRG